MKKIFILSFLFTALLTRAQEQFTNNGNLSFFSGAQVTFFGNFSNNGTFADSSQLVTFKGTAAQQISGTVTPAFNKLVINNTNGITLQQTVSVTSDLTLVAGQMDLNSNLLIINNSAPSAIVRTSGYILSEKVTNASKIKWKIDAVTGAYVFPFGTITGNYIPFTFSLTSGNIGNVTVSTYPTAANNTPYPVTPDTVYHVKNALGLDNSINTVDRFWQINKDGVSGVANIVFVAAPAEIGTIVGLNAQRWNTVTKTWDAPLSGQLSSAASVTVNSVSNFSPWTLSGNSSPLPIELVDFTAVKNETAVDAGWNTESEINCKYFTVERSQDAVNFEPVDSTDAKGAIGEAQSYSVKDYKPYKGVSYYRLRETTFDGTNKYHNLVKIVYDSKEAVGFDVYPNPTATKEVTIRTTAKEGENLQINVRDLSGRLCVSESIEAINSGENTLQFKFTDKLPAGVYMLTVNSSSQSFSKKLVVK